MTHQVEDVRTDLVSVSNRRGGKDKIHRAGCRHVAVVKNSFYVRPLRRSVGQPGQMSHRLYDTCGDCLKGYSTFRLPAEPEGD